MDDLQNNILLYAIASSDSDIRICQSINRILGINLTLAANIEVPQNNKLVIFRRYNYESLEEIEKYTLVVNRNEGNVLFRELKKIDYILLVNTEAPKELIEGALLKLKNLPEVTALYKLDQSKLKSFNRIIY